MDSSDIGWWSALAVAVMCLVGALLLRQFQVVRDLYAWAYGSAWATIMLFGGTLMILGSLAVAWFGLAN